MQRAVAEARAASVLCTVGPNAVTHTVCRSTRGSAVMLDYPMQRISMRLFIAQSPLMVRNPTFEALGNPRVGLADNAALR